MRERRLANEKILAEDALDREAGDTANEASEAETGEEEGNEAPGPAGASSST
jgi:hypothetical protein